MMLSEKGWYKAKLLPAATSIFTESFYPNLENPTEQEVYFTQVDLTPRNRRVLVASRFAENSFRMLTLELALHCLQPCEKASSEEDIKLNELCLHLNKHL